MVGISRHAQERYAERIMNRSDKAEILRYIQENESVIEQNINKMIEYGTKVYTGVQKDVKKDNRFANDVVDVIVNQCWIVIVDTHINLVVTLYKVDLGLDPDFTKQYVQKMVEKIQALSEEALNTEETIRDNNANYKDIIKDLEEQINELNGAIVKLKNTIEGYTEVIENNKVESDMAWQKVVDSVNKLIGKKTF